MLHYLGPVESFHPLFADGSKASFKVADQTILLTKREHIKDVEYSREDDEVILKFLRENISPSWHGLGTSAMKPLEHSGVVDGSLNVYGVEGLKVVGEFLCREIWTGRGTDQSYPKWLEQIPTQLLCSWERKQLRSFSVSLILSVLERLPKTVDGLSNRGLKILSSLGCYLQRLTRSYSPKGVFAVELNAEFS